MPTTSRLECRVPIRVRLLGTPSDEDLAGLEEAVARAVTRHLALAERLRSGAGRPGNTDARDRGAYEAWRDRPDLEAYEVPSYQQAGEPVRVPIRTEPGPAGSPADAAQEFVSSYDHWLGFDVEGAADGLVRHLERHPADYSFVRAVLDAVPPRLVDNVAAELLDRMSDEQLHGFAVSDDGRAVLDVLYEAVITGNVSEFERKQAERILRAKEHRITQAAFVKGLERLRIFPIRNVGITREATATFRARLLPDGKVRVNYTSVRLYEFDMFKADRETLPDYTTTRNGFDLDPEEIVAVRLHDQGRQLVIIPALALIDYSNQIQEHTLGTAATALFTGLTIGLGGLGGGAVAALRARVVAGEATTASLWAMRAVLWADRVAFAIPVGSMIINDRRDWILEQWPSAGQALLDVLDTANRLASYYGWGRLGVGTLRYLGSRMRTALGSWRLARAEGESLAAAEQKLANAIDNEAESVLGELTHAEQQAARPTVQLEPDLPPEPDVEAAAQPQPPVVQRPRSLQRPFMRVMLDRILSNEHHPLRFLVDPETRRWLSRCHLSELPTVQAGHLVSFHSGAPEALALEDSFFNQVSNWKGERYGAVFQKAAVNIGDPPVPVEVRTAQMFEAVGVLPEGTVERAMRSAGWTGR